MKSDSISIIRKFQIEYNLILMGFFHSWHIHMMPTTAEMAKQLFSPK